MKTILILILIFIFLLASQRNALAIYNSTSVPNNYLGIHIADTNNLPEASKLVNSNGGDWGYITLVIQKGERDTGRWQKLFDEMRRLHLIPIVRIATAPIPGKDNIWEKPSVDEIDGWASFLNSLNWVIKNRYVIIGNEPNHSKEWGGEINPKEYGNYLKIFSQKLKKSSEDFFIMPAGLDASAPTKLTSSFADATMDESLYLQKLLENPTVFDNIDGWSSHSYPNPNFSGSPDATGKGTIRTFDWEINYLKFLGINKNLPIFITETGWIHNTDKLETNLGKNYEEAFKNVWNDKRIVAITPFIYKYIMPPFDNFSWVNKDGKPYDFYNTVLNLPKQKGEPIQEIRGNILTGILPKIATAKSSYHALLFIKNEGQSIWQANDLEALDTYTDKLKIQSMFPEKIEPNQIGIFLITGNFPNESGNKSYGISIISNGNVITNTFSSDVNIIPQFPTLGEIINYLKITIIRKLSLIPK